MCVCLASVQGRDAADLRHGGWVGWGGAGTAGEERQNDEGMEKLNLESFSWQSHSSRLPHASGEATPKRRGRGTLRKRSDISNY